MGVSMFTSWKGVVVSCDVCCIEFKYKCYPCNWNMRFAVHLACRTLIQS